MSSITNESTKGSTNNLSVFVKKKDRDNGTTNNIVLSKDEVMASIPKSAVEKCDEKLALTHTEYRWRLLKIPGKKNEIVEMSIKKPNTNRVFMSKNMNWIEYDKAHLFDQYVTKEYFYYVSTS